MELTKLQRLVTEKFPEYARPRRQLSLKRIDEFNSQLQSDLENFITTGELPNREIGGWTIKLLIERLEKEPIDAFLAFDWLSRDPKVRGAELSWQFAERQRAATQLTKVKAQYGQKIKFDAESPQTFEFPDFKLIPIGPSRRQYIGTGKSKEYISWSFKIKSGDMEQKISLNLGAERPIRYLVSPVIFDGKKYLFEIGKSVALGDLADDEFVVRQPIEEELRGSRHIHFLE